MAGLNGDPRNTYRPPIVRPGTGIEAPTQELYNANSQTPPSLRGAWPVYPPGNRGKLSGIGVIDLAVSHGDPQATRPPYYPTGIKGIGSVELTVGLPGRVGPGPAGAPPKGVPEHGRRR